MERINVNDLRSMMKIVGAPIQEDRLQVVTEFLNQNMEALQPLVRLGLPKELEPTSYMMLLLGRLRK